MENARIRSFQRALYGWLAFYMLAMLLLGRAAWTNAPVQVFFAHQGAFKWFEGLINGAPAGTMLVIVVAMLGSLRSGRGAGRGRSRRGRPGASRAPRGRPG